MSCIGEQPSLAMGNEQNEVLFKIVSHHRCKDVRVKLVNLDKSTSIKLKYTSHELYDKGSLKYRRYAYFFKATIIPEDKYQWSFSGNNTLGPFPFTIRDLTFREPKFIQIGDMELSDNSKETLDALRTLDWSQFDGLIHAGDYAYDMKSEHGLRGDKYFEALGDIFSKTPNFLVLGNHENYDEGRLFDFRFRMPNTDNTTFRNSFYHVIRGNVFLLAVNYDYLITFHKNDKHAMQHILNLLDQKLALSHRTDIKWRVVVSHRPLYCGQFVKRKDCRSNFLFLKPIEQLYRKHGVHLMIAGHEHFYERIKEVDDKMDVIDMYQKPTDTETQIQYRGNPIQIVNGCGGNWEKISKNPDLDSLTDKAITQVLSYSEIKFTENSVTFTLRAASNGKVLDKTVLKYPAGTPLVLSNLPPLQENERRSLMPLIVTAAVLGLLLISACYYLRRSKRQRWLSEPGMSADRQIEYSMEDSRVQKDDDSELPSETTI